MLVFSNYFVFEYCCVLGILLNFGVDEVIRKVFDVIYRIVVIFFLGFRGFWECDKNVYVYIFIRFV